MPASRREFLQSGATIAAALVFGRPASAQERRVSLPDLKDFDEVAYLTKRTFTDQLETRFEVHLESGEAQILQLFKVVDTGLQGQDCFSILFKSMSADRFPQGTYRIQHEAIGTFGLFIVPITRQEDWPWYEAVFNRQTDAVTFGTGRS
jgi:hypothetical protein